MSPPNSAIEEMETVVAGGFVRIRMREFPEEMLYNMRWIGLKTRFGGPHLEIVKPIFLQMFVPFRSRNRSLGEDGGHRLCGTLRVRLGEPMKIVLVDEALWTWVEGR